MANNLACLFTHIGYNQTFVRERAKSKQVPDSPPGSRLQSQLAYVMKTVCKRDFIVKFLSSFSPISAFIMGNLNSRETMQLLENEEFKHVCKNLGDLLRHHGEYMQHRRHKSRKHRSHRGESKDRGRGESGEVSPELVKDLGWKCPGGVGCPMYKFVREQFRRNPPAEGESRHNINQNHHPRSSEPRYLMPHPPQPNRERNPSGRRRSQRFPNPQNGTLHPLRSIKFTAQKLTNVSI